MPINYLKYLPDPLLDDLVQNRWIPIVGAGMSRNAIVPKGMHMPLWYQLGKSFANEMKDYPYSDAVDAISAYAHEFGRVKLVEKLSDFLLIDSAKPGKAHESFCRVGFDIVCTTNLDFLVERSYEHISRFCKPVVDDDQLSVGIRQDNTKNDPKVTLLKLHGDVHNPRTLIVTEEDYESFLDRYRIKATYLANLLISRTAVLVGYSLDDPDFRQLWRVISDRLGPLRRAAYCISVGTSASDEARFERRHVKVIRLPGKSDNCGDILSELFDQLREHWTAKLKLESIGTDEQPIAELALPTDAATSICLFILPENLLSFYRERVFPLATGWGFVPLTPSDVVVPGDSIWPKIDSLMSRAELVVADIANRAALSELMSNRSKIIGKRLCVIVDETLQPRLELTADLGNVVYINRPRELFGEGGDMFIARLNDWFGLAAADTRPRLEEEPTRLLRAKEYRAAIIAAISVLEKRLRERLGQRRFDTKKSFAITPMIDDAVQGAIITPEQRDQLKKWLRTRNVAVHLEGDVNAAQATEIVNGVVAMLQQIGP